tara:strand:- start:106 stop:888 length:783 start_codon:yes stop_codon:yes gene_type:complete
MLDQFYTAAHEANRCIAVWHDVINVKKDTVVEPSAGDGSFSNKVDCVAYDLDPKDKSIISQDFLTLDLTNIKGNIHFIGNPPFGKSSSLAFKFINHMTAHKNTASFSLILPASHSRAFYKNRISQDFHLIHQHFVKDFIEFGKPKTVSCVFQIWVRSLAKRPLINLHPKCELINFVSSTDFLDFKIGSKYKSGYVFDKDFTYKKENKGSFVCIRVNCNKLKTILTAMLNKPLIAVNKNEFVAAPNISQYEVVNAVQRLMA